MDVGQMVTLVLASVGGSGAIIAGISSWLGKIWADRLLTAEKARRSEQLEELKLEFDKVREQLKLEFDRVRAQDLFLRELHGGIREYSSEQARGLRQAYLLLFEPESSAADTAKMNPDERFLMAIQEVMGPFRKHIGLLDEVTISKIYSVHNELLKLKRITPDEWKREKNEYWNALEIARQFVKADQIAYRRRLIEKPLEERKKSR